MELLFSLLPLIFIFFVILILRRGVIIAAVCGVVAALLIAGINNSFHLSGHIINECLNATLVLVTSVVIVIIPGLYLNDILTKQGVIKNITLWIEQLHFNTQDKVLILLLGLIPAVEAFTGFGISLFLSLPIFLALLPEDKALRVSLLGMNIMPWGTLALATIVGAAIIQQPLALLASFTSITSFLVFPYLAMVAMLIMDYPHTQWRYLSKALILGLVFATLLAINSHWLSPEIAGIIAGLITCLVGIGLSTKQEKHISNTLSHPVKLFLPYILILLFIMITKFIPFIANILNDYGNIQGGGVKINILTSPGIILASVALIFQLYKPTKISVKNILSRAKTPCLSIFGFLFLSELMQRSGMLNALANSIAAVSNHVLLIMLSPIIGILSGFLTASNTGGNALMMKMQYLLGLQIGHGNLFAAMQNSAAGHTVFSSLPIIALVLAIAKNNQQNDGHTCDNEASLLRFTLKVLCGIYFAILLGAGVLIVAFSQ